MSSLSLASEKKKFESRKLSGTEIVYAQSSSSSAYRSLKKRPRPANSGTFISGAGPAGEVRQRVLSAQMLKVKQLQNKLGDAQIHINKLQHENRLLIQLQKKQDSTLNRYEHSKAELPELLRSHDEEIRSWHAKCRQIRDQLRETSSRLKEKEQEVNTLTDQYRHLQMLSTDRNLGEREQLTNEIKELKDRLAQQDSSISLLQRKLALETKNLRAQYQTECSRHRETKRELEIISSEVTRLTILLESREKTLAANNIRLPLKVEKQVSLAPLEVVSPLISTSSSNIARNDSLASTDIMSKMRSGGSSETSSDRDSTLPLDYSALRSSVTNSLQPKLLKRRSKLDVTSARHSATSTASSTKSEAKPYRPAAPLNTTPPNARNKNIPEKEGKKENDEVLLTNIKRGMSELLVEPDAFQEDEIRINKTLGLELSTDDVSVKHANEFEEMFHAVKDLSLDERIALMKDKMRDKINQEFEDEKSKAPRRDEKADLSYDNYEKSYSEDEEEIEEESEEFEDEDLADMDPKDRLKKLTDSWKNIESELKAECEKSEAMFEAHCDETVTDLAEEICSIRGGGNVKSIDIEKKKNLLAALKRIDEDKKTYKLNKI